MPIPTPFSPSPTTPPTQWYGNDSYMGLYAVACIVFIIAAPVALFVIWSGYRLCTAWYCPRFSPDLRNALQTQAERTQQRTRIERNRISASPYHYLRLPPPSYEENEHNQIQLQTIRQNTESPRPEDFV